ncbi:helix-turn-helix domain-containing protein (plasmid) [Haloimpatiens sp. FM7330]|uniref:helix-turn-helix domain-containing protein n=1 Tax=Haloimpatiens sp. FM7330 TaxID=3298610 RepID=UPI003632B239
MESIKKKFGINVRKYRKKRGYSQEKLAELSGLHRTYISDVERGERSIALENIQKLSIALEIETYKLFEF